MSCLCGDTDTPAENRICFCLERAWVSIISREMIRVDPARNQIVEQPPPALRYVWVTATRTQAARLIKFHFDIINTHTHGHTRGADRAARSLLTFVDLSLTSLASLFPHTCKAGCPYSGPVLTRLPITMSESRPWCSGKDVLTGSFPFLLAPDYVTRAEACVASDWLQSRGRITERRAALARARREGILLD